MAVTITEDVISGASYSLNKDGGTLTRIFDVQGLNGTHAENCFNATVTQDSTTGKRVPVYGQGHPTIAGIAVSNISSKPSPNNSKTGVRVEVTYVSVQLNPSQQFVKIEITGTNGTYPFNRWPIGSTGAAKLDGALILIGYSKDGAHFPDFIDPKTVPPRVCQAQAAGGLIGGAGAVAQGFAQKFYDYATFSMLCPNTLLTFTRQRLVSPATGTLALSKLIRRKTNKNPWNQGDPGTWLCRNMTSSLLGTIPSGTASAANQLYEERYEFEWKPEGWNNDVAVFKSSINGQPPAGIDVLGGSNNGYTRLRSGYESVNFDLLRLPPAF